MQPEAEESGNLATLLLRHAAVAPDRVALVVGDEVLTYRGLAARAAELAAGLRRAGLREGDRVLLLFPPSGDFFALATALFASGMVIVLLDGAMGARRALVALRTARPRAVVSVRALLRFWPLLPPLHHARRYAADGALPGVAPLATLASPASGEPFVARAHANAQGLVSFTSGTTGRPKGVNRTHGVLAAQHRALEAHLAPAADEVDMPWFPAVALHDLCCGITTVLPPADLRRPAEADPARVLQAIQRRKVTRLIAAPAFLSRLADHMLRTGERAPSMRKVLCGGAPVPRALCRRILDAFPGAAGEVLYGSTEAEPIAGCDMAEVLVTPGDGLLVGRPVPDVEVALLALPAADELGWRGIDGRRAAPGEPGEVVVRGDHVVRHYVGNPEAERRTKIRSPDGAVWHRTGDVARFDDAGRLWLLGRAGDTVVHRGRPIQPFVVEAAVADTPGVAAAALIAHRGAPEGELCVELAPDAPAGVLAAVEALLTGRGLTNLHVIQATKLPMDARHQSKIDRHALRRSREKRRI